MSSGQIDTLFKQYELALDKLDLKTISGYCDDNFISAGPSGSRVLNREENKKRADEIIKLYKKVGYRSTKIISKRIIPICNEYSMVVVRWGITFEKTGNRLIEFDISYIVQEIDDPRIILLISHQDEEAVMKRVGLETA